jgi:dienelactone hydrolase
MLWRLRRLYRCWMHDWETRLTTRDTNRVVRPFELGLDWTRAWPLRNGHAPPDPPGQEEFLRELNRRIVADSVTFFSHRTPADFCLERRVPELHPTGNGQPRVGNERREATFLRFTSPVSTPFAENNLACARWFPSRGRRAVVVLPQWNSDAEGHNGLCRILNFAGVAALRLSLPYHDVRKPPETERADYAVSSNVARTIDAARQAVIDLRCCLDWLEQQGYDRLGVVGTSLGSCYAFLATAHEPRLRVNVFNHASLHFADVIWSGQSTRHIRSAIPADLTLERLRGLWSAISPSSYFEKLAEQPPKRSLIVYATHDLTFLPEVSQAIIAEFRRRSLDLTVRVLPCGHYTTGEVPFKYLDAYYIASFLQGAFA